MFYKLINGGMVVDLLREVHYVRYLPQAKRWINTDGLSANGIIGSSGNVIYHLEGRAISFPEDILTVELVQINEQEFNNLAANASLIQEENKMLRKEMDNLRSQLDQQNILLQQILAKL